MVGTPNLRLLVVVGYVLSLRFLVVVGYVLSLRFLVVVGYVLSLRFLVVVGYVLSLRFLVVVGYVLSLRFLVVVGYVLSLRFVVWAPHPPGDGRLWRNEAVDEVGAGSCARKHGESGPVIRCRVLRRRQILYSGRFRPLPASRSGRNYLARPAWNGHQDRSTILNHARGCWYRCRARVSDRSGPEPN